EGRAERKIEIRDASLDIRYGRAVRGIDGIGRHEHLYSWIGVFCHHRRWEKRPKAFAEPRPESEQEVTPSPQSHPDPERSSVTAAVDRVEQCQREDGQGHHQQGAAPNCGGMKESR